MHRKKRWRMQYVLVLAILLLFGIFANAQKASVSGIVNDANGSALEGVTVHMRTMSSNAIVHTMVTDSAGAFHFDSINTNQKYKFSFTMVGFKDHMLTGYQLVPSGNTSILVNMEPAATKLDEVVVNTGYQTIRKRNFTGAATKLIADSIRRDGVADVSRMLEGTVAGVTVQNVSGTFGAAPKIRIRGATSITGENKPLWVVDGIVLEDVVNVSNEQLSTGDPSTLLGSSVAGLNPDDIESFEVLKDAAATSLYGARAMNGVVVITTKKGRAAKSVTSYNGNYTVSKRPSYNSYDILDSYNQMQIFNELYMKGWLNYANLLNQSEFGVFGKMAELIDTYDETSGKFGLENTDAAKAKYLDYYSRVNTDWFKYLFNNSLRQEHSLSVNGGNEKVQTYSSLSLMKDAGWTKMNDAQRLTANLRTTYKPNSKLTYGFIMTAFIRDQHTPGSLEQVSDATQGAFYRPFDINPFNYALNTSRAMSAYDQNGDLAFYRKNYAPFNILSELDNNQMHIKSVDIKVQGELSYKISRSFTYSLNAAYRFVKTSQEHIVTESSNMANAYRAGTKYDPLGENSNIANENPYLYRDPNNVEAIPVSVLPYGGMRDRDAIDMDNYTFRNALNFSQKIAKDHRIDLFGFQELRYSQRSTSHYEGYGYQYDKGGSILIDPTIFSFLGNKGQNYFSSLPSNDRFLAFAATGTYSYKDKISLGGTIRYDGSNTLGKTTVGRWLPTWNVSAAWNIDGESWFERQKVITSWKLRSSYGLVASLGIAQNAALVLRNAISSRPYVTENESIMNIERLANSELTWEKMYKLNIGTDLAFLQGRYTLTVDYYHHRSFDLIGNLRTGGMGGEIDKIANYANLKAKGLEVTIGANAVKTKDWRYSVNMNFGLNKTEITDLRGMPSIWSVIGPNGGPLQGYPQRGLFSLQFKGLDPSNGAPLLLNQNGEISNNVFFQSTSGLNYLKYEGPIDPTFSGGLTNIIGFKSFTINLLLTGSMGNKVRLNPAFADQYTDMQSMSKTFVNRWVLNSDNEVPSILGRREASVLAGTYPNNAYNYSDDRVADGGFIRLKQIRLSYDFSRPLLNKIGFNSASLSLVGNNIALLYSDKKLNGQDPEFFASGGVALPLSKDYTISLRVTF